MLLLVLDTETTGLNPEIDHITELAFSVFDTETQSVLASSSFLLPTDSIPLDVQKITRITPCMTNKLKIPSSLLSVMSMYLDQCNAIIAHNAEFDKSFLDKYPQLYKNETEVKWICSYKDIEFSCPSNKLSYMSCDLGLTVQGSHRAMSDVNMLCNLLKTVDDLDAQIKTILTVEPTVLIANVSFERKDLPKQAGFTYNAKNRAWSKRVYKNDGDLKKYIDSLNFPVVGMKETK